MSIFEYFWRRVDLIRSCQALDLIETLLQNTPATAALFSKRLAMEAVSSTLRQFMFEEIVPDAILAKRVTPSRRQFLVSWLDST